MRAGSGWSNARCFRLSLGPVWGAAALGVLTFSSAASAATWVHDRTTPWIGELVSVDATGESNWPYGQEDVAGDGLSAFTPAEQAIDLRTVYAAVDAQRFWVRAYVSDLTAPARLAIVYVFVDADRNPATGGSGAAVEIDPGLTADPTTAGGYENVLAVQGDGTFVGVWNYQATLGQYSKVNVNPSTVAGEAGRDVDPIFVGASLHGYVQASVQNALVGLADTCSAILYVRSVSGTAGDRDIGTAGPCVPIDGNGDNTPDIVIPPAGCLADSHCPVGGSCVNGVCVIRACTVDAQCETGLFCEYGRCVVRRGGACAGNQACPAGEQCVSGRCLATTGGACVLDTDCPTGEACVSGRCATAAGTGCTSNAQCGDLICRNGQCAGCVATQGSSECGAGRDCSNDGRCITTLELKPGEKVEGGATHCAVLSGSGGRGRAALGLGVLLAALGTVMRRLGGGQKRRDRASCKRGEE